MGQPSTSAKVVLITTLGEFQVQLFAKEAPKACKNFIALAMQGYYDECRFFRVIPGCLAMTGDPTNTGAGGESSYGQPFDDQFNSHLKFDRRGQLGLTHIDGIPNSNKSQFFITLGECPELNRKRTLFGVIVGRTLFNLLRIQDVELDGQTPVDPIVIEGCRVLVNPFRDLDSLQAKSIGDIVALKVRKQLQKIKANTAKKPQPVKNKNLISFEEDQPTQSRISNSHDVLNDPRLLKEAAVEEARVAVRQPEESAISRVRKRIKLDVSLRQTAEVQHDVGMSNQQQIEKIRQQQQLQLKRIRGEDQEKQQKQKKQNVQSILTVSQKRKQYLEARGKEARKTSRLVEQLQQLGNQVRSGKGWFQGRLKFPVDGQNAFQNADRK